MSTPQEPALYGPPEGVSLPRAGAVGCEFGGDQCEDQADYLVEHAGFSCDGDLPAMIGFANELRSESGDVPAEVPQEHLYVRVWVLQPDEADAQTAD